MNYDQFYPPFEFNIHVMIQIQRFVAKCDILIEMFGHNYYDYIEFIHPVFKMHPFHII